MRHVEKLGPPPLFEAWTASATAEWTPKYTEMPAEEKAELSEHLYREQFGLCAYCTNRIKLQPKNFHVEHLRPQHLDDDAAGSSRIDYSNMVASCPGNLEPDGITIAHKTKPPQDHCGEAKTDWYDEDLFVSPLQPDAASYFLFKRDGKIVPAPGLSPVRREAAETTILKLRLDSLLLRRARVYTVAQLLKKLQLAMARPTKAQALANIDLEVSKQMTPNSQGKLPAFQPALLAALELRRAALIEF